MPDGPSEVHWPDKRVRQLSSTFPNRSMASQEQGQVNEASRRRASPM